VSAMPGEFLFYLVIAIPIPIPTSLSFEHDSPDLIELQL
jgi:hypothetical protein